MLSLAMGSVFFVKNQCEQFTAGNRAVLKKSICKSRIKFTAASPAAIATRNLFRSAWHDNTRYQQPGFVSRISPRVHTQWAFDEIKSSYAL